MRSRFFPVSAAGRIGRALARLFRREPTLSFDHYLMEARNEVAATAFPVSILHGSKTQNRQPQTKSMQYMQQEES